MFPNHGIFISSFQSAAETLKQEIFLMKTIFAGCFPFRLKNAGVCQILMFLITAERNTENQTWKPSEITDVDV